MHRCLKAMREHDVQPKQRRRYVVTTDGDYAGLIYPDLAKGVFANPLSVPPIPPPVPILPWTVVFYAPSALGKPSRAKQ